MSQSVYRGVDVIPTLSQRETQKGKTAKMATASIGRTHLLSGNAHSEESVYRDVQNPYITYTGTRRDTNPNGPRNVWFIHNSQTHEKTGPFITLKLAWGWVHGTELAPTERVTTNFHQEQQKTNGTFATTKPEPEITTQNESQMSLFSEEEKESESDSLIQFSCPHCGKSVVGLIARG